MKLWATILLAIEPRTGLLKEWKGMSVPGVDWCDAQEYLRAHNLEYLRITGEIEPDSVEFQEDVLSNLCVITLN